MQDKNEKTLLAENDLKDVLGMPGGQGIRVLARIVAATGIMVAPLGEDSFLNYQNGRKSVGFDILGSVKKVNPQARIEVLKEVVDRT